MGDDELIKETMMLDYSQLVMNCVYEHKENKRLNNIINELEKWLENLCFDPLCEIGYRQSLWKLKELRGDK